MPAFFTDLRLPLSGMAFNATTTAYNFGTQVQPLLAQTTLTLFYLTGAGENNVAMIWSRQSTSITGQRLNISHNSGSPLISYTGCTTGDNNAPQLFTSGSGEVGYNNWWHVSASWNGAITGGTDIILCSGMNFQPLVVRNTGTGGGSGSPDTRAAQNFIIGNSVSGDRTANGVIAYVALWNRVLRRNELRIAQMRGPLAVPSGLVICWANGRDYGPHHYVPTVTAPGVGRSPPGRGMAIPYRRLLTGSDNANSNSWFLLQ